jgi:hypothetical protein
MLDLEKRTPEAEKAAAEAVGDKKALYELLDGLLSKNCAVRYKNFKAVYVISEDHPEVLYPKWDFFQNMLNSENNTFRFYAIHVLANLARIDKEDRINRIFETFYSILDGDALVPACHVAYVSGKIAVAKPELADRITTRLLNLDKGAYKHRELVQANALKAFSEYFSKITDKERIVTLAKELKKNKSTKAKKVATEFLKKQKIT